MTNPSEDKPISIYDTVEILPGLKPQHLQRLLLVSRSLGSTLNLPDILKSVLTAATDLTESEGTSILLIEPNETELRFVASSTQHSLADVLVPLDGSLAGWVVTENKPVIIEDVENDDRHHKNTSKSAGVTVRNLLIVPLRDRGEVIGVLEAFNKKDDGLSLIHI